MRFVAMSAALLIASCGSRSGLNVDRASIGGAAGAATGGAAGTAPGAGGAGESGSGGVAGSGAAAGASGAPPQCKGIELNAPIATIDPGAMGQDSRPQLIHANESGGVVTTVFARDVGGSVSLRHASSFAWTEWAPALATTFQTASAAIPSPAFAAGNGINDSFPVLIAQSGAAPSLVPAVSAWNDGGVPQVQVFGNDPAFVANGGGGALVGTQADGNLLLVSLVVPAQMPNVITLGCATERVLGDAEAIDSRWLVAFSTGYPLNQSCGAGIPLGPPERIDIARVACDPGSCPSSQLMAAIEVGAPVETLATAPHDDGIWMVWKSSAGGSPRIEWALYRQSTANVARGKISSQQDWPLELAAGAIGGSLVVAWSNDPAANPPDLVVSVVNEQGLTTGITAIEPAFAGPLSVLGSPNADSAIVAWSGGMPKRVQLARFDCLSKR